MGKDERKKANEEVKRLETELDDLAKREKKAGIRHETEEYYRLNKAANDAAKNASWWHR